MTEKQDRFRGALLGLAVGDALGTTLEFRAPGTFQPLTDMVGGGPFSLKAGQWTDDTSMALCLADSLIACGGMDLDDQATRYVKWWKKGVNSVTGDCFDIGNTVRSALSEYLRSGNPKAGSTDTMSAGNGSIMRLAPVPMFFASDGKAAVLAAADSSLVTHGAKEAVDACRLMAAIMVGYLQGNGKEEVLSEDFLGKFFGLDVAELTPKIRKLAGGSYKHISNEEIRGTGYVVRSMEAALWSFWNSRSFEEGALLAVNFGDDADTTGAVFGQIAGAFYGRQAIPNCWLEKLAWNERITSLADRLMAGE